MPYLRRHCDDDAVAFSCRRQQQSRHEEAGSDAPRGKTSDIEDDAAHAYMAHIITVTASWRFIRMERKEAIL